MKLKVPNFAPIPGLTTFLNDMIKEIDGSFANRLDRITANNEVLLYSPNRSVYSIKVSDAGVISATKVSG